MGLIKVILQISQEARTGTGGTLALRCDSPESNNSFEFKLW